MSEDESKTVPSVGYFARRANLALNVTDEDLKATEEFLKKMEEERQQEENEENFSAQTSKKASKTKRRKKTPPEKNVESSKVEIAPINLDVKLSPAAKRRLKKLEMERQKNLEEMEFENQKIFSSYESYQKEMEDVFKIDDDHDDANSSKLCVLKVKCLSEISYLTCQDCDKFSTIFPKVAGLFNLKASEILLCYNDQMVYVHDTPKSLDINYHNFLECIPYKPNTSCETEDQSDENSIKIKFQASDAKRREKKLYMIVHKLEKMQDIMEKYSKLRNIPLNLLSFEFDGETLVDTETPIDLDMESGSVIDVNVSTSNK